jgi:predicted alpha-1,2-mannosidase
VAIAAAPLAGALPAHADPQAGGDSSHHFATSFEAGDLEKHPFTPSTEAKKGATKNVVPFSENLSTLHADGVSIKASAPDENPPDEVASKAADASPGTKWLAFKKSSVLTYSLNKEISFDRYWLTTGNDSVGRDPKDFTVEVSDDGKTYQQVDSRKDALDDAARGSTTNFTLKKSVKAKYVRLDISANHGESALQLAEFDLGTKAPEGSGVMTTELGKGPDTGYNIKAGSGYDGATAVHYAGRAGSKGAVSADNVLVGDVDVELTGASELSYSVLPTLDTSDLSYPSTYVGLDADIAMPDGSTVRASSRPLTDQYGFDATATGQGKAKSLYSDQWNRIRVDLSAFKGGHVKRILLSYHHPGAAKNTKFSGWVDSVGIADAKPVKAATVLDRVDTRRGTNSSGDYSRGNNFPAAAMPNGFNFLTPMTDATSRSTLYSWASRNGKDNLPAIEGFGISHEPSIWMGDRDQLSFMPTVAKTRPDASIEARRTSFSHDDETARPDKYEVELSNGISVGIAPTDHGGVMKVSWPKGAGRTLLVDKVAGDSKLTFDASGRLSGWVEGGSGLSDGASRMFIAGSVDQPVEENGTASGRESADYVRLGGKGTATLKFATSFISQRQAQHNLDLEVAGRDYGQVVKAATKAWLKRLNVIDLTGSNATDVQQANVYSDLYRLNLYPNSQHENTGTASKPVWKHASPVIAKGSGDATDTTTNAKVVSGKIYVNNGFWDTYRTAWPLYSFLYPKLSKELVSGFVQQYREGGWIARWSSPGYADLMTGTSSDASFAEAYTSGAVDTALAREAYDAAIKNASVYSDDRHVGRKSLETSTFLGYVPNSLGQSVSWGLEGAVNDAAISHMGAALAKDPKVSKQDRDRYAEESEYYSNRAGDYVNLYDPEVGAFASRNANGSFKYTKADFDPEDWGADGYTEAAGWTFQFHGVFDVASLAARYGGSKALDAKLRQFFDTPETGGSSGIHEAREARDVRMGQWAVSNQPGHHIPYLAAANGNPALGQEKIREAMDRVFVGGEIGQGYPGDEDNGELSSWYLFSSLGFYPLSLGSGQYQLGSPLFDKAVVHRESGKDLTISAPGNSMKTRYVAGASVGGKPLKKTTLKQADLAKADSLRFTMSATPSRFGAGFGKVDSKAPSTDLTAKSHARTTADNRPASELTDDNSRSVFSAEGKSTVLRTVTKGDPAKVSMYTLTNSKDGKGAPRSWILEGSQDGQHWKQLDQRAGEKFADPTETRPFVVKKPGAYRNYRLTVTSTNSGTPQLGEYELLADLDADKTGLSITEADNVEAVAGSTFSSTLGYANGVDRAAKVSATVDFLDGKGAQKATVRTTSNGSRAISAQHTFMKPGVYDVLLHAETSTEATSAVTQVRVGASEDTASSIAANANSTCFTTKGEDGGDCDQVGGSYDRAEMAKPETLVDAGAVDKTGFTFGATHTLKLDGKTFHYALADIESGEPDNIIPDGQTLPVLTAPGTSAISFVGLANEGTQKASVKLNYSDGTSATEQIAFGDWVAGADPDKVIDSNERIAYSKNVRLDRGKEQSNKPQGALFSTDPIDLEKGKRLASVEFVEPETKPAKGALHVVALATDTDVVKDPGTVKVQRSHDDLRVATGTAFDEDLATFDGVDQGSDEVTAVVNWGDGSGSTTATGANSKQAMAKALRESSSSVKVSDGKVSGGHAYAQPGKYTLTVTVSDGTGAGEASIPVTAVEPARLKAPSTSVAPGKSAHLTGTGFKPGASVKVTLDKDGGTPFRSADPTVTAKADAKGAIAADLPVPADLPDAAYPVTADDGTSAGKASATVYVRTPDRATSIAVTAKKGRVEVGRDVVLTARVSPASAPGTVEFLDGKRSLGTAVLSDGTATLRVPTTETGRLKVKAVYAAQPGYKASTSATTIVTVAEGEKAGSSPSAGPAAPSPSPESGSEGR